MDLKSQFNEMHQSDVNKLVYSFGVKEDIDQSLIDSAISLSECLGSLGLLVLGWSLN